MLGLFLATLVLPGEVTIISQYVTVRELGLANTLFGVALPGMIGALNVLLMYNAFRSLPVEVDQAAIVDGANVWQRFVYIGLPSVRGTISVVAIFAFIGAWDDFLWPLIVLTDPDKYTLTVGLQYLSGTFSNNPRLIAAGTMIAFIPIVIVFAVLPALLLQGRRGRRRQGLIRRGPSGTTRSSRSAECRSRLRTGGRLTSAGTTTCRCRHQTDP